MDCLQRLLPLSAAPLLFHFLLLALPAASQPTELLFAGFKDANPRNHLTLNGVAEIEDNGLLRLTNQTSRFLGQCFYSAPLRFKDSPNGTVSSFSTTFVFAMVPEYATLGGHGLAFTLASTKNLNSLPSQYLGLFNAKDNGNLTNHVVAVEFDTVQDFEFQDINDNHVGVDINGMVSNASAVAGYFSNDGETRQNISLKSGKPIQAWIEYDSVAKLINVTLSPNSTKPRLPILSSRVDLAPILREEMYVGFSASTGLLASSHYVMGWSFKINGQARDLEISSLPSLRGPKKKHTAMKVGLSVSAVILALSAIAIGVYLYLKIKNADVIEDWELEIGPHRYRYEELKEATRNFSEKELLGHGGFGRVYRGTLPHSKTLVAVKRVSHESKQGVREFVSEIASIGRLRHRNLVQLLGWCRRRGDLLLVYDFMANGSLDNFLFDEPKMVLTWEQRFKIIKDVASGLLYLHEGYEQVVLHRDVKASNVLLDGELNGHLGDFGLARLYERGANPGTTRVVGTLGYLAPELPRTGKSSTSSDVYGFGAMLLEVACGRRPIEPKAQPEELVLVDWVWDLYRAGRVLDAVDPKLEGRYEEHEALTVLKLGLMCSNHAPSARPRMRQVVRYLDGETQLPVSLKAPNGLEEGMEVIVDGGFDEFVDSFDSRSFDRTTCSMSLTENGYGCPSFPSMPTAPLSLLRDRR